MSFAPGNGAAPGQAAPQLTRRLMRWLRREPVAAVILLLCLGIEAALEGAEAGLWGRPDWRDIAFNFGAFQGGLLLGWQELFPLQKVAMFFSYSLLHGGFWHVTLNMLTLVSLAPPVTRRIGQARFLALYVLATIGGGAGFVLFSFSTGAMIGASGALFGLVGALLSWVWSDRRAFGQSRAQVARALTKPMLYLIGLNVVLYWATQGALAWGAHLGGFLVGWIFARIVARLRPVRASARVWGPGPAGPRDPS